MTMNESRVEKWTSSEGRTEIHYFRLSDDEYLFGYNPLLIREEEVAKILDVFGIN